MSVFAKISGIILYDFGLLERVFYWKTCKYLKDKYYAAVDGAPNRGRKTIVYMLDGRGYSGGITDIVRGIVSMFKLSKEVNFDFKINFCYPYKLSDYFEPKTHNWEIADNEISYNLNHSAPFWIYSVHNNYAKSREFEVEFQRRVLKRFIAKNESISQFHIYANSDWSQGCEYSSLFKELFKPTRRLLDLVSSHKKHLNGNYVSMTFRFQQLLGDFVERQAGADKTMCVIDLMKKSDNSSTGEIPKHGIIQLRAILGDFRSKKISIPLNEDVKNALIDVCIKKVIEIHAASFPKLKVLVTADSESFLRKVSRLDFVYAITNENLSHERGASDLYNIFAKAYVDMLMIADADKIFLLVSGPMYRSGFAKNASMITNGVYEEVTWQANT